MRSRSEYAMMSKLERCAVGLIMGLATVALVMVVVKAMQ